MLFGKLLPREGNFFELFNQHGGYIVEGARSFILLIQNYADLDLPIIDGLSSAPGDTAPALPRFADLCSFRRAGGTRPGTSRLTAPCSRACAPSPT